MDRQVFVIATSLVLLAAFALGWFAHWLVHRLTQVSAGDIDELDRLARELHEAEELRDEALTWAERREEELVSKLNQAEAELRAAMEGLRDARAESEELRSYVEQLNATS
jgi:C4-dicarboxylate-specific signal transduction histidine kinase